MEKVGIGWIEKHKSRHSIAGLIASRLSPSTNKSKITY